MAHFSEYSLQRLRTAQEPLRRVMWRAILLTDFRIISGARDVQEQLRLIRIGASGLKDPTRSKHVVGDGIRDLSAALDVTPWHPEEPHIRWDDTDSYYQMAAFILAAAHLEGVPLRWGGLWQKPFDPGHFELIDEGRAGVSLS